MAEPPKNTDPPPEFLCPVTHDVFTDPVIAADGITYEREMLEQLVSLAVAEGDELARLPVSRMQFTLSNIVPNLALRDAVTRWKAEHSHQAGAKERVPEDAPRSRLLASLLPPASLTLPIPPPTLDDFPSSVHFVIVLETSRQLLSNAALHANVLRGITDAVRALDENDRVSLVSFGTRADTLVKNERPCAEKILRAFDMIHYDVLVNMADGINKGAKCTYDDNATDETLVVVLSHSRPTKGPPPEFVLASADLRYSRVVPVLLSEDVHRERWWRAPVAWSQNVLTNLALGLIEPLAG